MACHQLRYDSNQKLKIYQNAENQRDKNLKYIIIALSVDRIQERSLACEVISFRLWVALSVVKGSFHFPTRR